MNLRVNALLSGLLIIVLSAGTSHALCLPGPLLKVQITRCTPINASWANVTLKDGTTMKYRAHYLIHGDNTSRKPPSPCEALPLHTVHTLREGKPCCDSPNVECDPSLRWLETRKPLSIRVPRGTNLHRDLPE